eukprot:scaffold2114_cov253-Pinguiococcus_pyrenoidosus.AAC.37
MVYAMPHASVNLCAASLPCEVRPVLYARAVRDFSKRICVSGAMEPGQKRCVSSIDCSQPTAS